MTREEPVEAGSIDLMSWEDDSTDGTTPVKDKDHNTEFRKRADSMEGETFPKAGNLVEIEASISVTPKTKVESTPDTTGAILDLDEVGNRSVDHVVRKRVAWGWQPPVIRSSLFLWLFSPQSCILYALKVKVFIVLRTIQ